MRPNLGHVEDIPLVLLGLFGTHQLDIDVPDRIFTPVNSFKHVTYHKIRILPGDLGGFLGGKILNALLRFDVDFGIFEGAVLYLKLVHYPTRGNSNHLQT